MDFEKNVPEWQAQGTEPPASLREGGFQAGYKPPAAYFNWFWHGVSVCLTEIRSKLSFLRKGSISIVEATSTDGVAYAATVPDVSELYNGMMLTIIPNMTSTSKTITLNVNGLGDKMVRLPLSFNSAAMTTPRLDNYYNEGRPLTLQFDANYIAGGAWKTIKQRTSAQDLYGTVPVESGGTGAETAEEARANLGAVSMSTATATLTVAGWSSNKQTVNVTGVTASNVIIVSPVYASKYAYDLAGVGASEQAAGKLTFTAKKTPTAALTVNILIFS